MSSNRPSVRAIFCEAVEMTEPAARAAYLAGACGGDELLRREVEALLRAHEIAGKFLVAPADQAGPGETPPPPPSFPSDHALDDPIGRFKLLERIGEGGCGVVYRAEQLEPVRRTVALKIIKPGMDTRSVIARFERERQTLALMNHPHIARILDAGATDRGRPYFVMELVEGQRITEFCDAQSPAPADRLRLFVQVCQAVQHAHLKGVIHRDLKPSNILIAVHDGVPTPKIIDFGIAKATGDFPLIDQTVATRLGAMLGTPAYMSPEQAESDGRDVDSRTDVYSLGVLLYELLTGCTPYDQAELQRSGVDGVRRILRDTEPLRPSSRLRALAPAELDAVAKLRSSPPPRLIGLIRGDLDWIVLKAMDKDPTRRYQTASELGHDVERFLQNEPIAARRPGLGYSIRKLVQRNRLVFGAAAAVGAALALGLGLATVLFFQERAARERAVAAEKNQSHLRETADAAQRQAQAEADFSRRQLIRLSVQSGNKLVDDGDAHGALLWFAEALHLETRPEEEIIHRRRFGATLRSAPDLLQLWLHDGPVIYAEFSPDGAHVVTTASDSVQVWDSASGAPVGPPLLAAHGGGGAFFVGDGRDLMTADAAGHLRIWDWRNGRLRAEHGDIVGQDESNLAWNSDRSQVSFCTARGVEVIAAHDGWTKSRLVFTNQVLGVRWSRDGRRWLVRTGARSLQAFDPATGEATAPPLLHRADVSYYRSSSDGQRAYVIARPDLQGWDAARGEPIWPAVKLGADIMSFDLSPDATLAATAGWDGSVRLFNSASGQAAGDVMRHRVAVSRARFSPDGRRLATASWDGTARLWSTRPFEPASPSLHHAGYVLQLDFSPNADRLLTAGPDKSARLWSLRASVESRGEWNTIGPKTSLFSPDSQAFLTTPRDRTVRIWNVDDGRLRHRLDHDAVATDAAFAPAGNQVGTVCADGTLHLWDAASGQRRLPPILLAGPGRRVAFSADGQRVATLASNQFVEVWHTANGRSAAPGVKATERIRSMAFSGDGEKIVTAGQDHNAHLWSVDGQEIAVLPHPAPIFHLEFNRDGTRVLTACSDLSQNERFAQVWHAATGQPASPPLRHLDGVLHAAFSPDGRLVATGSEDKTAIVWDAATGERVTPPLLHGSYVVAVAFSPDSRLLVSCSSDDTARVWDARTGAPVTPPWRHGGDVTFAAWSPDGNSVATVTENSRMRLWQLPAQDGSVQKLQRWAELLSAHRLDANGGFVPLTAAELRARREQRVRDKAASP